MGSSRWSVWLSWLLWPVLYGAGLFGASLALDSARPLLWFNVMYLGLVAAIALLERLMPFEPQWLEDDGETGANLAHTLFTKGLVQIGAALAATLGMATASVVQPAIAPAHALWPAAWPLFAQVVLGLVIAELGLYAAHRIAHEWPLFWRFHALHHSVVRLWVINTGRFHIADSLFKVALSQIPLYLMGAPLQVFWWLGAVTAFMGILTHCNVDMRTGVFDYIFSTPRLHRWHHSKDIREGNTNYGENVVVFDLLFGTYFNPDRPSSTDIGIRGEIAKGFLGQLAQPFSKEGVRQILGRSTKNG